MNRERTSREIPRALGGQVVIGSGRYVFQSDFLGIALSDKSRAVLAFLTFGDTALYFRSAEGPKLGWSISSI